MRKLKLFLSLLMLFSICVGNVWAETATLDSSTKEVTSATVSSVSKEFNGVTCLVTRHSSNAPGFYEKQGIVRYYSSDVMTLSVAAGNTITQIDFSYYSGTTTAGTADPAGLSGSQWKGSAQTVSFTGTGTTKISSITVTYSISGTTNPTVTIEPVANDDDMGSVSMSGSVITATANDGYCIDDDTPYTVLSGDATVERGTGAKANEFTVTATENSTVRINFKEIPSHNINFNINGGSVTPTSASVKEGVTYTDLPEVTGLTPNCEYGTFEGWTLATSISNGAKPEMVTSVTMSTSDVNLNAVYSKTEGGSAATNTVTFSENGYEHGDDMTTSAVAIGSNFASVTFNKGSNSNNGPKYYTDNTNGPAVRCYGGNYFTVSANSGNITAITLSFTKGEGSNTITTDKGTYNNGSWTGEQSSVKFTIGGSSGHRRVASIAVTIGSAGTTTYSLAANCCDPLSTVVPQVVLTQNQATLTWDAIEGVTAWSVTGNVKDGADIAAANIGNITDAANSKKQCIISNLASSTAYEFQIHATIATGYCTNVNDWTAEGSTEAAYTIAEATNNELYGSVSRSGNVITGTPAQYCQYATPAWTATPANSAEVAKDGNTFTVTPSTNTTVTINFEQIPVTGITLSATELNLLVNGTENLSVTAVTPAEASPAVNWSIEQTGNVISFENGVVTALKAGTATITATSQVTNAVVASCAVTVTAPLPTITITQDQLVDFTDAYDDYAWSIGGVQGIVGAYKSGGMQFNSNKAGYYAYNTTAIPGNITKIAMTKASGTTRSWTPYVSDEAMITADANKALEAKNVEGTVEWNVTGSNQYFYLQVSGGATVISSIVITYEPIYSAVTLNNEAIENGSVGVTGADDLTAVAAGTVLTLTNDPDDNFQLVDYDVYKTGEPATKITVTDGKFTMPLYGVTVSASFEEEKELDHLVITTEASQKTFWVGEEFNYNGLKIKAVYNNDTEKDPVTPKSVSTPDMSEAGEKTVTIAYQEKEVEKTTTYKITVKDHPTDANNPCTVAEALDYLDKFEKLEGAYVTGKVSEITEATSTYITYNISDDGLTTSPQLLVYKGKDFDGNNFPSTDALVVGDLVVVNGKIFTYEDNQYNQTKEFAKDNQIVSRPKKVVSIALSGEYTTEFNEGATFSHEGMVVTATYNYGEAANVSEDAATTWSEPDMTTAGEKTVTVSYTFDGKTVTKDYTITIVHVCASEVAITKGAESHGTYTVVEGNVCGDEPGATVDVTDIEPAEGYRFKEITATNGTVDNENKQVTGITAATTITVVFEEIPSYEVTWNVNGDQTLKTSVKEGSKPVFPATPEACDATSTTFVGWANAAWEGKAENLENKTVHTSAADMPDVDADVTYYAVFAKADGAGSAPTEYIMNDNDELNANWKDDANRNNGIQSYAGKSSFQMYGETNTSDPCKLTSKAQFTNITSVSMNVAANKANTVTLYYSANGTDWTAWENTVSVLKNTESYTDYAFNMTNFPTGSYYIRLSNSTSSMYLYSATITSGSAPTYTDYLTTCCTKYDITIDSEIEHGSVSADLAKACEGATVTLTPAADPAYHFDAWAVSYNDGENDHEVTVNSEVVNEVTVYSFTMPAYAVTVSATFEHDECTQLGTPANVEVVADYKSAMLDWDDVTDADHYVVTIKKGEETVESNTVDASEYEVAATLLANTTYTYEIQATANDALTHCPSALATDNFETEPLPSYNLTLMENGVERAEDAEYTKSHELGELFNLPASATGACTGKVFVGWSADENADAADDLISGQVSLTKDSTLYAVYAQENVVEGDPTTITLTNATIQTNASGKGSYNTYTLETYWTGRWCISSSNSVYSLQLGYNTDKSKGAHNSHLTIANLPAGAKSVHIETQNNTASGRTFYLCSADDLGTASSGNYGSGSLSEQNGSVDIAVTGAPTTFHIYPNGTAYIKTISVTYAESSISHSNYTTSCAAQLADLTFSPEMGEFTEAQSITINGPQGATIYYTLDGSEPTTESEVYSTPIPLANKCGEQTIRAFAKNGASESAIANATYTLNLPMLENSQEAPYTPAQAIAVYDGNGYCYSGDSVYIKGVVKTSSGLNSQFGDYDNIVVAAEGTTTPEYTFFHMYKGAGKVHFTPQDVAIEANDTIEAYGVMTYYEKNDIYEFTDGCYLIGEVKKYSQPKTPIESSLENPITIAAAIDYIDHQATYDLSQEVYVKAVANAAPTNAGTFTGHDANVEPENSFQFYNTNLNENTIVANDTVIVKGIIKKVNTTYRMDAGVVQEVNAYDPPIVPEFTVNPTAVAFGNVEKGASVEAKTISVELTAIENATVTLADENNVFSIDVTSLNANGTITVTANSNVDIANYDATITLHDVTAAAQDVVINVSMNVTAVDERKVANSDANGFTAISGDLDPADITFAAYKGGAQNAPATNNNAHQLRLYKYQETTDFGGYLTLKAVKGCKIDQVQITVGGNCKVDYSVNAAAIPTKENEGQTIGTQTPLLTAAGLNADSIRIANIDGGNTFQIVSIKVWYTGEAAAVDHYELGGTYATEFDKNAEFNHDGLIVYAAYDELGDDKVDITADCSFSTPNMSTPGEQTVEISYKDAVVKSYTITINATGKDDPALAWMRGEEVISEAEVIAAANVASWSTPTLRNEFNVTPTYNSNNTAVATVDENGVIALAGGYGTATITASFAETEEYIASVATYTITVQEPVNKIAGDWRLVTSTADLTVGSKVIIVGTKNSTKYAMGEQKPNNRAAVAIISEENEVIAPAEGTKTFTLEDAGDGKYAFKANNGKYLYAAGSTHLKEQNQIDGNASWTITITNEGTTIEANGTSANKLLRLNPNGGNAPLFSCYQSGQNPVTLYVNRKEYIAPAVDPENPTQPTPVTINTNVEEEEIVASGNIVVTVDASNFEEPKSYIAQDGATIIINNGSAAATEAKSIIADTTSTIKVEKPTTVNQVFSVAATMGAGVSGQITGSDKVTIAASTEAYFDITLGDNANAEKWHAIAVPFPVDAINGIYDAETGAKLTNEVNYAIMDYHGDIRATGAYGWKKYRNIMQPGVFYLMTVDGNTKTFRFKMSGVELPNLTSLALQLYAASGAGQGTDAGWNGVANPMLKHGTVNQTVTVLNPSTYTYEDHDAGSYNFVVGTPFFIQADAQAVAEGMQMGAADNTKPYYAPKRASENGIEKIRVFFGNDKYQDKLTISANEEALNEYEVGKDLIKMTMTNTPKVAQIFGNAYGTKLCRANLPLINNGASMDVDLYAPEAGEYSISVPAIEGYNVYLTQNGNIIWNLSMSAYTAEFAKGNTTGYGIRIVKAPQVTTDLDNLYENESGVQKVIIDEHVFILRGEKMYDVNGQMVK